MLDEARPEVVDGKKGSLQDIHQIAPEICARVPLGL
jgi:hypothetical protein